MIADDSFSAARQLELTRSRSCVSRAYYAAYSTAVAALIDVGVTMPARGNPSHDKVPVLMRQHLSRLTLVRRSNAAAVLSLLYRLRIIADYQPHLVLDRLDARQALGFMVQLFRDAKEARQ